MNKLIVIFTALFLCSSGYSYTQSPYQLDWKTESILGSIGMSTFGTSLVLKESTPTYSQLDIADLSRARINSFDRVATYNYSTKAGLLSDHLSLGSKFLPLAFLAGKDTREDFGTITILYVETFLVANGLTSMTKTSVLRPRPFVFNENVAIDNKLTANARYSFISGHTSKTAAMTFFTAKVYNDYHPDSKWRPIVWGAAAAVPAVTGYLRVKAGKHYPSDVIAGYAVGALSGILVPHFHKRIAGKAKDTKLENLKLDMGSNEAKLTYTF